MMISTMSFYAVFLIMFFFSAFTARSSFSMLSSRPTAYDTAAETTNEIASPISMVGILQVYAGSEIIAGIAKVIAFAPEAATNAPDTAPPMIAPRRGFLKRNPTAYRAGSVIPMKAEINADMVEVLFSAFFALKNTPKLIQL